MKRRGPVIAISGISLIVISLFIASSILPDNFADKEFSVSSMFEGMFDEVSNELQIMPGDSAFVTYSMASSNVPLMWGIQIIDYTPGDKLMINISNIFGDDYGKFVQNESLLFEVLEIKQSDTLNFEIQNFGSRNISIVVMFSEDPENSSAFSGSDSPVMRMILPLAISGFLIVLGIIMSIIGTIVILVDLKNIQNNKRSY